MGKTMLAWAAPTQLATQSLDNVMIKRSERLPADLYRGQGAHAGGCSFSMLGVDDLDVAGQQHDPRALPSRLPHARRADAVCGAE
jgi:hypothetical protein